MSVKLNKKWRYALAGFGCAGLMMAAGLIVVVLWTLAPESRVAEYLQAASILTNSKYKIQSGIVQVEATYRTTEAFNEVRTRYVNQLNVREYLYGYNGDMCSMMRDSQDRYVVDLHTTVLICSSSSGQRIYLIRGLGLAKSSSLASLLSFW